MKCFVKIGFAGPVYASAPGKEINLPLDEARSLAHAGIVEMMEDYTPPMAYATAIEAQPQNRIVKPLKRTK
jgi:hypothetical protein